jgi:hypothetical protein
MYSIKPSISPSSYRSEREIWRRTALASSYLPFLASHHGPPLYQRRYLRGFDSYTPKRHSLSGAKMAAMRSGTGKIQYRQYGSLHPDVIERQARRIPTARNFPTPQDKDA